MVDPWHSRMLGAGAGLAALAGAGGALVGARVISGPRRPWPPYRFTPFEVGVDAEEVRFRAADGVDLAGWWCEHPGSEWVVVVCHGHRSNMAEMLGVGPGLWRAGHSVLLFDFRGNGDSGDGPQSLAHYETRDLRAALDLAARRRPDARLAVVGFSMGAAVAALVAADDPRVAALVLDSPFADMRDVVATAARRMGRGALPAGAVVPLVDAATRWRYGYRFDQVRPVDVVGRYAPRPALVLHGDADHVIPVEHGRRVARAIGPSAEYVEFPGADHCGGYFVDRAGYIARLTDFLDAAAARPAAGGAPSGS